MSESDFTYTNLSGRRRGPLLTATGWVLRGVARVQDDVAPFAQAWRAGNLVALGSDGPLWVALGDSLTQGVGATSHERGWVGLVGDRLAQEGKPYRVVNLGVSGARTADVLQYQVPALEALDVRPELVTLMIGSNDLMRPSNRRALGERFETLLRRLPSGAMVMTLPNPSRSAGRVNAVLSTLAKQQGLVVIEMRDPRLASWRGRVAADHFHPNDDGYAAIADVIGDAVLAHLRSRFSASCVDSARLPTES